MKLLVDRCAGRRLAQWLRGQGHDVRKAIEANPDPGGQALLIWAVREQRILVTIDSDFGLLVFLFCRPVTIQAPIFPHCRNSLRRQEVWADPRKDDNRV